MVKILLDSLICEGTREKLSCVVSLANINRVSKMKMNVLMEVELDSPWCGGKVSNFYWAVQGLHIAR